MDFSPAQLKEIGILALQEANKTHDKLGEKGEKIIQKNAYGDTALKVDIEAEKAIIEILKNKGVPIRIISEEHGIVGLCDDPKYFGILDGLDGSKQYLRARGKSRYGTMFGIFSGVNPSYNDYLFSGIMEHSGRKLIYAAKGEGSHLLAEGTTAIQCSKRKDFEADTRIFIDQHGQDEKWHKFMYETFTKKLPGFTLNWLGSSAIYYVDLSIGETDLVLECTRKGNLEIAIAYGLITESGGVMVTLDGKSVGPKKYLEFGQDQYVPIISACTKDLANSFIKHLNS